MNSNTLTYLESLKLPKDVLDLQLSMPFGDENKYVTIHVPDKFSSFELLHITDVQFGHKMCNVQKFVEYRDWVLSKPNRFVLFGGDMIDAATLISVGSPLDNTGEPQDQVYQFCKLAAPFRHRVIGYVSGNHERRGIKTFGDLGKLIATFLKIPYSSGKQFIDLHYGQHKPFKIAMHHGVGAAGTKGARLNMLEKFMKQGNAHLYLVGHLHDVLMTSSIRERQESGKIIEEEYAGVMSSSFLRNLGTYAEVAMLPGNTIKMWRALIKPNGHWELNAKFNIE